MCSDQECRRKNFGVKTEKNIAFSNEATIYKIVRFPKSVGEEKQFFYNTSPKWVGKRILTFSKES